MKNTPLTFRDNKSKYQKIFSIFLLFVPQYLIEINLVLGYFLYLYTNNKTEATKASES